MSLVRSELRNISYISGSLIYLEGGKNYNYGAILEITMPDGQVRTGQVLDLSEEYAVVQVFEETFGIDRHKTTICLRDKVAKLPVSKDMVGRIFSGSGKPLDNIPPVFPEKEVEISGMAINPSSRNNPDDFIQTGISTIDVFNTIVRGQKLPVFAGAGLPANQIVCQILQNAKVVNDDTPFVVVFGAMGITQRESAYFIEEFNKTNSLHRVVAFLNLAGDPTIERLLIPRYALTTAEYLAFEHDYHVLVILTDMTNYCEALREVASAREEIPGRRGYPGYMYTDLSSIYERAGRIKGKKGSVTQIPILTLPDDDITHPIPDLTGYITEGQIVLDRSLHRLNLYPPINILPSLSRLMNNGIGEGKTREDHRKLADQLYASYAGGKDVQKLAAIIGEEALSDIDKKYLEFLNLFNAQFVNQGDKNRSIQDSLDLGWQLLTLFPPEELKRLNKDLITKYFSPILEDGSSSPYMM